MNEIPNLQSLLLKLSQNKNWGGKKYSIHHPNTKFIQIDLVEFKKVNKLLKDGISSNQIIKWMIESINFELTAYPKIFKGIEIKFYESFNGEELHSFII